MARTRAGPKSGRAKAPFEVPAPWALDRGGRSMSLRLQTKDFKEAVNLINAIAPIAEEVEHHPDFHLEKWNQLRITTYSHDVGKLTSRDLRLAKRINDALKARGLQ